MLNPTRIKLGSISKTLKIIYSSGRRLLSIARASRSTSMMMTAHTVALAAALSLVRSVTVSLRRRIPGPVWIRTLKEPESLAPTEAISAFCGSRHPKLKREAAKP